MKIINLHQRLFCITFLCLISLPAVYPGTIQASWRDEGERIFSSDDQYIQVEARTFPGENKSTFGIEVSMTPKPDWKLCASNSSSIKPLRLKISPTKCLKLKGATQFPPPDLSGTDDSGSYSEYYTKTARIRQEFSKVKCSPDRGGDVDATLTYLLCQNNRCVGPFSKEIRFRAHGRN